MRTISKKLLSWLAVTLGFLIGFFALARFGMAWPPFGDSDPGWLLRWISYVGGALLGPVFIAASTVALRNPKRAGLTLYRDAACRFFTRVSCCWISSLAFGWQWLVRAPRNSDGHRLDGIVLSPDLRGTIGTPPQKTGCLSFRLNGPLGGDCL